LPALAGATERGGDPAHLENIEIFDFELSDEDMRQISEMGSAKGRLTDYGFAPKWD
jgi:diketogulonate reductase-like aldo/keto reductase